MSPYDKHDLDVLSDPPSAALHCPRWLPLFLIGIGLMGVLWHHGFG